MPEPPPKLTEEWAAMVSHRDSEFDAGSDEQRKFRNSICELLLTGFDHGSAVNPGHQIGVMTRRIANFLENDDIDDPSKSAHWINRLRLHEHKRISPRHGDAFEFFSHINCLTKEETPSWFSWLRINLPNQWLGQDQDDMREIGAEAYRLQLTEMPILHVSTAKVLAELSKLSGRKRSAMSRKITLAFREVLLENSNFGDYVVLHIASTHALICVVGSRAKTPEYISECANLVKEKLSEKLSTKSLRVRVSNARNLKFSKDEENLQLEKTPSKSTPTQEEQTLVEDLRNLGENWKAASSRPQRDEFHYLVYVDGLQLTQQCWRDNEATWKGFIRSSKITPLMDSAIGKIMNETSNLEPRAVQKGGDDFAVIVKGSRCAWVGQVLEVNHSDYEDSMNIVGWTKENQEEPLNSFFSPFWWWGVRILEEKPEDQIKEAEKLLEKKGITDLKDRRRKALPHMRRVAMRLDL